MPLITSTKPEAFSKNVATEIRAGAPRDQAVAIAYSQKSKAQKLVRHKAIKDYISK